MHSWFDDIRGKLRMNFQEGEIRLDEDRMIMIHLDAFGAFRRELIDTLGFAEARGLLVRMGYAAGARDAELARRLRGEHDLLDAFEIGPLLHAFEGLVAVEPARIDIDVARGRHHVLQIWRNSAEASAHLATLGISRAPICWMQIGYASGYNSAFFGRSILFRETACRGMGHENCEIEGRPAQDWPDAEDDVAFLRPTSFVNRSLGTSAPTLPSQFEMIGVSPSFISACRLVERIAGKTVTALLLGETGVGKEMFAQALHRLSPRRSGPFVSVDCGAIPANLVEAELFGVEKGAFTGASASRPGRFERADGGTLFLDEIGNLPLDAQQKLLRVLQQRELERVGATRTRKVDFRLIAATNADLRSEVAAGRFREDLYHRINVIPIRIPPLRQRREDIPLLVDHFSRHFAARYDCPVPTFSARAIEALSQYEYPGNIRELENLIERAVILSAPDGFVGVAHLFDPDAVAGAGEAACYPARPLEFPAEAFASTPDGPLSIRRLSLDGTPTLDAVTEAIVAEALRNAAGNVSKAARLLGISRRQLDYRLKRR